MIFQLAETVCGAFGNPAITGIAGTLIGAVGAILSNVCVERCRQRKEAASVKASLIAEISALVAIAEHRKYADLISKGISELKANPGTPLNFQVSIPKHYSRIYQANAHRIGIIDENLAVKIVNFHQIIDAVILDVIPGGPLYKGAKIDAFEETQRMLNHGLELGREIAKR